jgi:plasmid maintenance system antidote protein VapI
MGRTELLNKLKGDQSRWAWARSLGLEQTTVNNWFNGGGISAELLIKLTRAYPEHRDEIIAAFDPDATPAPT